MCRCETNADPHRHEHHAGDACHPPRREALRENRRRAVEGAPPEHEHPQHEHQHCGFLEVQPLEERGKDAGHQQPHADVVGRPHAPEQRARQHQQSQAYQAPDQVRHLEHRERQELVEERQPLVHRGGSAGEQQQRACEKGQRAGDLRHDRRDVQARQLLRPGEPRALFGDFLGPEQQRAEQQRHEVVNGTIGEQRAEQRVCGHARQRQQDHRLEHPDPAGHVAEDTGDHRGRVHAEERYEANLRVGRQQRPQHRCGQRQVEHAEHDLRQPDRRPRGAQRPAADLERAAREAGPRGVGDHRREQQ